MRLVVISILLTVMAQGLPAAEPETVTWMIGHDQRQALIIPPSRRTAAAPPVVFVFHGHGGRMANMARLGFDRFWPEAVIVCPQGLPTATRRDPQGQRSGWQPRLGANDDRDLKFVDAMLATLREKHGIDQQRIFATGHSNGGGFTYLLGATRPDGFAAIAPSAAGAGGLRGIKTIKPLPVLHVAGRNDQIVTFERQERTMAAVKKLNGCPEEGRPWAKAEGLIGTLYVPEQGPPVVTLIHEGNHKYPAAAPELIVKFFQEQPASHD